MKTFKQFVTESANAADVFEKAKANSIYLSGRAKDNYEEALTFFAAAVRAKEIYNSDYADRYSYGVSRGIEKSYDAMFNGLIPEVREKDPTGSSEVWGVNVQSIKKTQKAYAGMNGDYHIALKFLENIEGIPDAIKTLKTFLVKGRKPAPVDPNKFVKPELNRHASQDAEKFLREAVASFKAGYEGSVTKNIHTLYNQVRDLKTVKDYKGSENAKALIAIIFMRDPASKERHTVKLKENHATLVARLITDTVNNVIESFVSKNTSKLGHIFGKKGSIVDHRIIRTNISGNSLENTMFFKFDDNSSFYINSQVIMKFTSQGKMFGQYPTRFSDVTMADGSKMKMPSEEKMIKEF